MRHLCENSKYIWDVLMQSFLNVGEKMVYGDTKLFELCWKVVIFVNLFSGIWDTFQNIERDMGYQGPPPPSTASLDIF